jgi:DNA-binding winged helix-turn-helix (wHTH) protein
MQSEMVSMQTQQDGVVGPPRVSFKSRFLRFGEFHIDLKREELFRDGTRVRTAGKVYQALLALLEQPGEIVSRDAMRLRLWPEGTHVNFDANVNTTVNKLRLALGDSPERPKYVETIPRQGYSFVGRVEELEHVEAATTKNDETANSVPRGEAPAAREATKGWLHFAGLTPGWVKAGAIVLLVAGMLFGAAIVIYAHHGI